MNRQWHRHYDIGIWNSLDLMIEAIRPTDLVVAVSIQDISNSFIILIGFKLLQLISLCLRRILTSRFMDFNICLSNKLFACTLCNANSWNFWILNFFSLNKMRCIRGSWDWPSFLSPADPCGGQRLLDTAPLREVLLERLWKGVFLSGIVYPDRSSKFSWIGLMLRMLARETKGRFSWFLSSKFFDCKEQK